jgi:hypothetical protein
MKTEPRDNIEVLQVTKCVLFFILQDNSHGPSHMPKDRAGDRVSKRCKSLNILIKPFADDIKSKQSTNLSGLEPDIRSKKLTKQIKQTTLPSLAQKTDSNHWRHFQGRRGPLIKTDRAQRPIMDQYVKRECAENVIGRSELRRLAELDDEGCQKWKRNRYRKTPAAIRGTSTDREESPSHSDYDDAVHKLNRLVPMDTGTYSEADDRWIPDIMKPLKEDGE